MNVLEGKNGFLFLDNDTNHVIEQVTGKRSLDEYELQKWKRIIYTREEHAQKHNYIYLFLIPPNKHIVYSEYLPESLIVSSKRPAVQLENCSESVFYPINILLDLKNTTQVYYKTDTHWTPLAVIAIFNALAHKLGTKQRTLDATSVQMITGDLGLKYNPPRQSTYEVPLRPPKSFIVIENKLRNTGGFIKTCHSDATLPRGLIFGDSFLRNYIRILGDFFSELYFYHGPVFDISIIETIKPDIVINENVERFINTPKEIVNFDEFTLNKVLDLQEDDTKILSQYIPSYSFLCPRSQRILTQYKQFLFENQHIPFLFKKDYFLASHSQELQPCEAVRRHHAVSQTIPTNLETFFSTLTLGASVFGENRMFFREYTGTPWISSDKDPFHAFAVRIYAPIQAYLKTVSLYLGNILANKEIYLSIIQRSCPDLQTSPLELAGDTLIFTRNYGVETLGIRSNDVEEVCFITEEIKLLPDQYYIVIVESSTSSLDIGQGPNFYRTQDFLSRGFYMTKSDRNFKVVSGRNKTKSVAWKITLQE